MSNDQDRERRVEVTASAPAWVRDLVAAAGAAADGPRGSMPRTDYDAVMAAIAKLIECTGYNALVATERGSADRYEQMLSTLLESDRARFQMATMMAAATLAATGATDALAENPRMGIIGRNLALTMLAAAAATPSAQ